MLYDLYKKIVTEKATFKDYQNFMMFLSTHVDKEDMVLDIYRKKFKEERKKGS